MSYRQYYAYGAPAPSFTDNPLTYCLVDSMDKNFLHGSNGIRYRPESKECQLYMSEKCANEWDGFCEYSYQTNTQKRPPSIVTKLSSIHPCGTVLSVADNLLASTAERKYCTYEDCKQTQSNFDPMNPNGVKLNFYADENGNMQTCTPVCRVNIETINEDPVMQRLVENPDAAPALLHNICKTAQKENVDLSSTILFPFVRFFNLYVKE